MRRDASTEGWPYRPQDLASGAGLAPDGGIERSRGSLGLGRQGYGGDSAAEAPTNVAIGRNEGLVPIC